MYLDSLVDIARAPRPTPTLMTIQGRRRQASYFAKELATGAHLRKKNIHTSVCSSGDPARSRVDVGGHWTTILVIDNFKHLLVGRVAREAKTKVSHLGEILHQTRLLEP